MKKIIALLMVAAMLVCICACKKEAPSAPKTETEKSTETSGSTEYYKTDVETNEFETPYGTLSYPIEWVGKVDVTTVEEGENFRVIFKAKYNDLSIPLYDIVFGKIETENAFKIGDLPYEDTSVEVYCDDHTLEGTELVPEEFSEEYAILCEDLNVIISHLVYDHGMIIN